MNKFETRLLAAVWALVILAALGMILSCGEVPKADPEIQFVQFLGCTDGDTCHFSGFQRPVRLARIDAPELDGRCPAFASLAHLRLQGELASADEILVDSLRIGYYGRIIAEIWADGRNLSDLLLETGLVVEYGKESCQP